MPPGQNPRVAIGARLSRKLHRAALPYDVIEIRDDAIACRWDGNPWRKLQAARNRCHPRAGAKDNLAGANPILPRAKFRGVENYFRLLLFEGIETSRRLATVNINGICPIHRSHPLGVILAAVEEARSTVPLRKRQLEARGFFVLPGSWNVRLEGLGGACPGGDKNHVTDDASAYSHCERMPS